MKLRFCVGALALSLAASVPARAQTIEFTAREAASAQFVKDQPYSGEGVTTVRQTLADGTRIERRITARFFRDSSGRIRREQTILGLTEVDPSGEAPKVVTIVDPVEGVTWALNPATRTVHRIPFHRGRPGTPPLPPPGPAAGDGSSRPGVPPPPPPPPPPGPAAGEARRGREFLRRHRHRRRGRPRSNRSARAKWKGSR